MEIEQAIATVNALLLPQIDRSLSDLEIELLRGAWDNLTYEEIAEASGYSLNYLQRDIGPKFWKLLSEVFGRKLNKTNVRAVLTQQVKEQQQTAGDRQNESAHGPVQEPAQLSLSAFVEAAVEAAAPPELSAQDLAALPFVAFDPYALLAGAREPGSEPNWALPSGDGRSARVTSPGSPRRSAPLPPGPAPVYPRTDWNEALDVSSFYGRSTDLEMLCRWVEPDRCRLVLLLGMGGMGKSSLAAKLAQTLQNRFDYVVWRSLRNAPPLESLLADLVPFLSGQQETQPRLDRLLYWLQQSRCLLILDNVETILQAGKRTGDYLAGYEAYGECFRLLGVSLHQSCVLLTSREKPAEIGLMEGVDGGVRSHLLSGCLETALALLEVQGIAGSNAEKRQLCQRYRCSPLALKIVATSIQSLFDGQISPFLAQDTLIFNSLRRLLDQQFGRLSAVEQSILYWLAINREWTSIDELMTDSVPAVSRSSLLTALESLSWRSLIERAKSDQPGHGYTLQPVVMEYVTQRLIDQIAQELATAELDLFTRYALIKTTVKDYVRSSQTRLILQPIAEQFYQTFGAIAPLEQQVLRILTRLRQMASQGAGYGAGNLINLCLHIRLDLSHYDFSGLSIWHAYLQGATLHRVNFAYANVAQTRFTQSFGTLLAVAISADGQFIATADDGGIVQLWQADDVEPIRMYHGHTGRVWAVAFSPDGQWLISGSSDHTLRLWDVHTGRLVKIFSGHTGTIRSVAVNSNGSLLASASEDGTARLWDIATGTLRHTLTGHQGWVRSVAFSPDGQWLISGSFDQTIHLWDVSSGEHRQTLKGHTSLVTGIAFSPDGRLIASGSDDHTVRLWDAQSGQCLHVLRGHSHWVFDVVFSPDGRLVASGSVDGSLKLWCPQTGQPVKTLSGHTAAIRSLVFHPSGDRLISGGEDQTLRFWQVDSGQLLRTLQGRANWYMPLALSPDGQQLIGGSVDHAVYRWDLGSGQPLSPLRGHTCWLWAVAFSPDGTTIATGAEDFLIYLWDAATGQPLRTLAQHTEVVRDLAFSPDGRLLASAAADGTVLIWEVATGQVRRCFTEHHCWVERLAFAPATAANPQPQWIASLGTDARILLWEAQTGAVGKTLAGPCRQTSLAFHPQGTYLASGGIDDAIRIWDLATGTVVQTLPGHGSTLWSVQFSRCGRWVVSGGNDCAVRLWDLQTGQEKQMFLGHRSWVQAVLCHPDGSTLISGSKDEEIRFWDMATGTCLRSLRQERPYEGLNITGLTGLNPTQKEALKVLGAIEGEE